MRSSSDQTSKRDIENQTIDFYNRKADDFISRTLHMDMQSLYEPFLALLPPGGRILDAGCGSGRDSRFFIQRGYQVTAFDGSEEMARRASELIGQPVLWLKFNEMTFEADFEAVWASASLLHVPKSEIDDVIDRLSGALVPDGIFYLSFKYGDGEAVVSDRLFSYYTETSLMELLERHPELALIYVLKTADSRPELADNFWLNILLRKNVR